MPLSYDKLLKLLGISIPILSAPMATVAGGSLAAQVTLAGGFGFIGAGAYTTDQLVQQIDIARKELNTPNDSPLKIGVGFVGWVFDLNEQEAEKTIKLTLDKGVVAIWLAFGDDLYKWIQVIRKYDAATGRKTLIFVQLALAADIEAALRDWKVDVIVAQGYEAGGHAFSAAQPLKSIVQSLVSTIPPDGPIIVGAGGLATGEQIAEILNLGAAGVVLGTRFCLTPESTYSDAAKQALLSANSEASAKSMGFDLVAGFKHWPKGVDGRALRNASLNDYEKGEDIEVLRSKYKEACAHNDTNRIIIWAGAGVGQMNEIKPAKQLVQDLYRDCLAHFALGNSR